MRRRVRMASRPDTILGAFMKTNLLRPLILCMAIILCGCNEIDALLTDPNTTQRQADGKAIGGGCRNGARGIEDCFLLNPKASKAAIFAGWKEMDVYMRENNVPTSESKIPVDGDLAKPPQPEASTNKDGTTPN
jgi:hypothetical protein